MRISDWSSDVCSSDLPAALKSLAAGLKGTVQRTDFEDIDDAAWASESAKAGDAQPLQRLQWLDALVAGSGELLPGYDPDGSYKLNKWPQTEREYPRHFRIATAMMKRSEEHTSELQSLMRISYAGFCLTKKKD